MEASLRSRDPEHDVHPDHAWVQDVLATTEGWQDFVLRYSAFIQQEAGRHLSDPDAVRDVLVTVLQRLHQGLLATYRGRASLAAWLILVVRSAAMDHLRAAFGRRELPAGVRRLDPRCQAVFRFYYVEGLPLDEVRRRAASNGSPLTQEEAIDAVQRIEAGVSDRALRRATHDLYAQSVGAVSGRLLEFMDHLTREVEQGRREQQPDYAVFQAETSAQLARLREIVAALPDQERAALELRFEQDRTAPEIAAALGLGPPRRAYTLLNRALRHVRQALTGVAGRGRVGGRDAFGGENGAPPPSLAHGESGSPEPGRRT